jgi:hypothetical protein
MIEQRKRVCVAQSLFFMWCLRCSIISFEVVFVLLNHKFLSGVCVAQSLVFMWCLRCSIISFEVVFVLLYH